MPYTDPDKCRKQTGPHPELSHDELAAVRAAAPELLATVDWLRQTYHRAHHNGDLDTCEKNTCQAARDVMAKANGGTP